MKLALPILVLFACTASAADPPEITLRDVPDGDSRNYKAAPFIAAAAKFQALGKEKACALLVELADIKKAAERHKTRLQRTGLAGDALENAIYKAIEEDSGH